MKLIAFWCVAIKNPLSLPENRYSNQNESNTACTTCGMKSDNTCDVHA